MKRSSFLFAVAVATASLGGLTASYGIDIAPNNSNPNTNSNNNYAPTPGPYSGSMSVDPYGFGSTAPTNGAAQDPFFNPQNYFVPVPQMQGQGTNNGTVLPNASVFTPTTPSTVPTNTVPNPAPATYPNENLTSRDRIAPQYNPGGVQTSSRRWRLGVYSRDTDTGVRIEQIIQASAADRARLEAKDVIIAVNGYQVGWVGGALYDCSTEFERRADNDGWVSLLVQNHRDGSLVNVPLQLESRMQSIQGSLGLDGRQLPQDAIVQVELREIVRPEAPPVTVASAQVADKTKYPMQFKVEYDPLQVDSRRSYVVTASVTQNGQLLYETRQNYPVLSPGQPKQIALALERVQTAPGPITNPRTPMDRNQQMAQIQRWFREYLGRNPNQNELALWMQALDSGYTLPDVQVELLSNNQLFNQLNRDKQAYITQLHKFMIGREPTPEEMQYWLARYEQTGGLRHDFARDFQAAVSAR
ncbi:MAG: YbaY family lipoprotein [Planctomycetaceae bacterium]|nr:YbaY family lipoprotein [Planctomycetaceae bacterium]